MIEQVEHRALRVAVFDSGVGGLSIYAELRASLPNLEYHFVSDNAAHPYGDKPASELVPRVAKVIDKIVTQLDPDLVVVACNTASTVALPRLRAKYVVPFVGVVPAIKPAAKHSQTRTIAIVATPATVERTYTLQLIEEFAADCHILKIGSSKLVQLAEQKLRGASVDLAVLEQELAPIIAADSCDTVVLACTHFPLLLGEMKSLDAMRDKRFVDSGKAIARRVGDLLPAAYNVMQLSHSSASWMTRDISEQRQLISALSELQLPYAGELTL